MHDCLYDWFDIEFVCFPKVCEVCFDCVVPHVDDCLPAALSNTLVLESSHVKLQDLSQVQAESSAFVNSCEALGSKVQEVVYCVEINAYAFDDANNSLCVYLLHVFIRACHEIGKDVFVEVCLVCVYGHGVYLDGDKVKQEMQVLAHGACKFLLCGPVLKRLHKLWCVCVNAIDEFPQSDACIGRHINMLPCKFFLHTKHCLHVRVKYRLYVHALHDLEHR